MYMASGRRVMRRLLLGGSKAVAASSLIAIPPSATANVTSSVTSHCPALWCTAPGPDASCRALCHTNRAAFGRTVIEDELLRDAGDALTSCPLADVRRQARPACAVDGRPPGAPLSRALQRPGLPDVEQRLQSHT